MKITKEMKELAKKIHKAEHLFVDGKWENKHKIEEYYYLLGSLVLTKLSEQIKDSRPRKQIQRTREFPYYLIEYLNIKDVSKQQKYLWQTLEDSQTNEKAEVDNE